MVLLSESEINIIAERLGLTKILKWHIEGFEDIIGYLGDHLKLIIEGEKNGTRNELRLFVKCMPRFDKWKSDFLQESKFFYKEYVMLDKLFGHFRNGEGNAKWRPKSYYAREDLFVFEDVNMTGYKMPHCEETMTFGTLQAIVKTVAIFHAQSYVYEENRSKKMGKPYRICDEFGEYLQEPIMSKIWRDVGRNAVIDYLKVFSKYKSKPDFSEKLDKVIPMLFDKAIFLMKPNEKYRNVVVHRDLWSNNIFIKNDGVSETHTLLVDFQTVIYSSPMLDLSSLLYMNTLKSCRDTCSLKLIEIYYMNLSDILKEANIDVSTVFPKDVLEEAYNDSLIFALTQASIIIPYTSMNTKWKKVCFSDPVKSERVNLVSRSEEFIEIAKDDSDYRNRVTELLEEIVERYVYPDSEGN